MKIMNAKEIADKLHDEFKRKYFVAVAYDEKEIGEDTIAVGIDKGADKFYRKEIDINELLAFVKKQLRGYSDVEIILDDASEMVIVYFNKVSEYSYMELIQTIRDLVYGANAKFGISY